MKMYEIRQMTTEEILKRIEEEKNNLVKLRFLNKLKQLTNTSSIKNTKKAIARMYTELSLRKKGELNKWMKIVLKER